MGFQEFLSVDRQCRQKVVPIKCLGHDKASDKQFTPHFYTMTKNNDDDDDKNDDWI